VDLARGEVTEARQHDGGRDLPDELGDLIKHAAATSRR
jgi:hypothetical protein